MSSTRFNRVGSFVFVSACLFASTSLFGQTTQPTGSGRQPIVTNQFQTTQGGALQARRPGNYIQQAVAEHQGMNTLLTGDVPVEPRFFHDTVNLVFEAILDSITNFLNTLNLGASLGNIFGTTSGTMSAMTTTPTTIANATTTGQGTTTPIQ